MIDTHEIAGRVIEKLCSCSYGFGWSVLVWKDGTVSSFLGSYGGEQDGNNPIAIINRDKFGDADKETGNMIWENAEEVNAEFWDQIQSELNKALEEAQ